MELGESAMLVTWDNMFFFYILYKKRTHVLLSIFRPGSKGAKPWLNPKRRGVLAGPKKGPSRGRTQKKRVLADPKKGPSCGQHKKKRLSQG